MIRWQWRIVTLLNLFTQRVEVHFVPVEWTLQGDHLCEEKKVKGTFREKDVWFQVSCQPKNGLQVLMKQSGKVHMIISIKVIHFLSLQFHQRCNQPKCIYNYLHFTVISMVVPLNYFRVHTWSLSKYPYISHTILQRTLNLHQAGADCLWKRLCPMSKTAADNCHLFAQDIRKLRVKSIEHVSCHSRDAVHYSNDIKHNKHFS